MKSKPLKKYKIPIELYDTFLEVWVGGTEKAVIDYVNKEENDKDNPYILDGRSGAYFAIKDKTREGRIKRRILWIEYKKPELIVHELFHAVCEIMAYKNIHLTKNMAEKYVKDSEEAYAYFFDFLYRKVMKLLK